MRKIVAPTRLTARPKKQPKHREHVAPAGQVSNGWHILVARQLTKKQVSDDKKAQEAQDLAWKKLTDRETWALDPAKGGVLEYDDVIAMAKRKCRGRLWADRLSGLGGLLRPRTRNNRTGGTVRTDG